MKDFASDNLSGASQQVVNKVIEANNAHDKGYFNDNYTVLARELMQKEFAKKVDSYFLINGTGVNVVALNAMLPKYGAVIATENAHINTNETGALEHSGHKIYTIATNDDKLSLANCKELYEKYALDTNCVQPKVICLSQPTEKGTVYTIKEIKDICTFAHANDMTVYIDGARLANALAHLNTTFKEMLEDTGVDAFSFGGTKNGALYGEMLVFLNTDLAKDFIYIQKEYLQLLSKSRFISCQFVGLFEEKLYLTNATNANKMTQLLYNGLIEAGIKITQQVETNSIFCIFNPTVANTLLEKYLFYVWNKKINEYRLMTSFDTTPSQVAEFIKDINLALKLK